MSEASRACRICEKRRPKRYCPGVSGDICPICCGVEREVTVNCPLDCPYLRTAREHDELPDVDPRSFPNNDIRVDEAFLRRTEPLLVLIASSIAQSALATAGVIDNDIKDALNSLVRTYRTLQSGLIAEARPDNILASRVYKDVQETVADTRTRLEQQGHTLRDADVLGILAFLQRMEIQHNNGRPKGRAFIDFLRGFFPPGAERNGAPAAGDTGGGLIVMP
jgi:hypothetical protein